MYTYKDNLKQIKKAIKEAKDFSSVYRKNQRLVKSEMKRAVDTEGRSMGQIFPPNTRKWQRRKLRDVAVSSSVRRKKYKKKGIRRKRAISTKRGTYTGKLSRTVGVQTKARIKTDRMKLTYRASKALIIQYGFKGKKPAVFFDISPKAAKSILNDVMKHINEELGRV